VSVDGSTASTKLYFSGTSLYVDKKTTVDEFSLTAAQRSATTRFKVHAPNGAFKDVSSQPSVAGTMEFSVIADDTTKPQVYMRTPTDDSSTADDSPSTDVTLYFSEGVQASTANGKNVQVDDGATNNKNTIPVDNSRPDQGSVTVVGSSVTIDPFNDMAMSSSGGVVTVTVAADAILDLYGQGSAAISSKFKTDGMSFTEMKAHNTTLPFSAREGATVYYTAGKLMLYGGKKGKSCYDDLYTSPTGRTWTSQTVTGSPGKVAYAPSAQDANGCVWMVGGQCSGPNSNIYKSCDAGITWSTPGTIMSVPSGTGASTKAGEKWPASFEHHAIAIVGGWQLVVVDSWGGKV
jgi:hypothetical protein